MKRLFYKFSFAILATLATLIIARVLSSFMAESIFLLFAIPVGLTAWLNGFWPAIVSAILAMLCADYFFIQPVYAFNLDWYYLLPLIIFFMLSFTINLFKEKQQLLKREQVALEEAHAANRAKDLFLAIASHELRTPLTAIIGWIGILQRHQLSENDKSHAFEVIKRNAHTQAQLIEDLVDVTRITEGKLNLETRRVNINQVVEKAIDVVKLSIAAKEIQFSATLPDDEILVLGDSQRLQQVIWNLVSNAIKFTPKAGKAQLRLEQVGSQAQITVADNGVGIDPEFLPYIFDRFSQENSSVTRKYGGLGLGLAIVRYLVEMHGGTIEAHSPGIGLGATFIVKLPLINEKAAFGASALASQGTTNLNKAA
jgi:signal transduction histidine kinase